MVDRNTVITRIEKKQARVGVVGIGYVGASVVDGASGVGFSTTGFDVDEKRADAFNKLNKKHAHATTDMVQLAACDVVCICVPTPLLPDRSPDYTYLQAAAQTVATHLRAGQLIILESSVAPGTTRNLLVPILERSGLKAGEDFYVGYSPERIDPGNAQYTITNIPKVVSGIDPISQELTALFYGCFVKEIVPVSSPEVAELTKILENLFRLVNISLVNELAEYAHSANINLWEVIDAAATKPFGFLAHYPSAGAGGYCIPVLPKFLLEDAQKRHIDLPLVRTALAVNENRPQRIAQKAFAVLNGIAKEKKPRILLIGITYKSGNQDTRESTALQVWEEAVKMGADVSYHDPYVPTYNSQRSVDLSEKSIADHDVIIITTAHKDIPYDLFISAKKPVLDTKNILKQHPHSHIHRV